MPTDPTGRCSAIPYHLVPAPQYNQGTDNGRDDAGTLIRAIQVDRAAEKSRHYTSNNSQYSRQNEALRVILGRRNPSGDEARDGPDDDCPDDLARFVGWMLSALFWLIVAVVALVVISH